MKIKHEKKATIALVLSMLALFMIILQFIGSLTSNEDALVGSIIGGVRNEPTCLWVRGEQYNLMSQVSLCERLFSRYSANGECVDTPGVIEYTDKKGEIYTFGYDGYCKTVINDKGHLIYTGSLI